MKRKILFILISLTIFFQNSSAKIFDNSSIKKFILENKITVIVYENPSSSTFTSDVWIKTGSINETEKNSGISHFLEHMLFKGTKKRKTGEIDRIIEGVGGRLNASTSMDFTHYYITLPKEYLELAIEIQADMIKNPTFPEEEIEKERAVILEEIYRKQDIPESYLNTLLFENSFILHPYKFPVLGKRNSLLNIKRKDFFDYLKKFYVPENIVIVVCGGVKYKEVIEKVKKYFGNFSENKSPQIKYPVEPPQLEKRKIYLEKDLTYSYIGLAYHGPSVKDIPDVYAMDLIITILGQGRSSRLYQNLKQKKQLVTEIDCNYLTQRYPGLFYITAVCEKEKEKEVIEEILKEIEILKNEKVSEKELEKAKRLIYSLVAFDTETNEGKASFLGFYETIDSVEFAYTYLDQINKITAEDIKKCANKYFGKENYTLCVLSPKIKK